MKGSIKNDAIVFQDMRFGQASNGTTEPPLIFNIEKKGKFYSCTGAGYGVKGDYGNGPILVDDLKDLIIFEEKK